MTQLRIFVILIFMLFLCNSAVAQEKKGNIVEYFGKEKVEQITEGDVVHVFKEGLVLAGTRLPMGSGAVSVKPLFA